MEWRRPMDTVTRKGFNKCRFRLRSNDFMNVFTSTRRTSTRKKNRDVEYAVDREFHNSRSMSTRALFFLFFLPVPKSAPIPFPWNKHFLLLLISHGFPSMATPRSPSPRADAPLDSALLLGGTTGGGSRRRGGAARLGRAAGDAGAVGAGAGGRGGAP